MHALLIELANGYSKLNQSCFIQDVLDRFRHMHGFKMGTCISLKTKVNDINSQLTG